MYKRQVDVFLGGRLEKSHPIISGSKANSPPPPCSFGAFPVSYTHLKGYDVYIGKNETKEIDFVASKRDKKIYVQVCKELPQNSDREIENLLEIRDNFPKYIVTLDDLATGFSDGIRIIHLADFLLENDY